MLVTPFPQRPFSCLRWTIRKLKRLKRSSKYRIRKSWKSYALRFVCMPVCVCLCECVCVCMSLFVHVCIRVYVGACASVFCSCSVHEPFVATAAVISLLKQDDERVACPVCLRCLTCLDPTPARTLSVCLSAFLPVCLSAFSVTHTHTHRGTNVVHTCCFPSLDHCLTRVLRGALHQNKCLIWCSCGLQLNVQHDGMTLADFSSMLHQTVASHE